VGKGGRKAVFSETPFEAEDLPEGYETYQSPKGGYFAAPKENMEDVVYRDSLDERHKVLGYPAPKPADGQGVVVSARDDKGRLIQDVLTTPEGVNYDMTIKQASEVAGDKGAVEVRQPEEALAEREEALVGDELVKAFSTVEGYKPKVYKDSVGLKTVGVGFNMEQEGAKDIWRRAGVQASFDDVYSGKAELNDRDIRRLLTVTTKDSVIRAKTRAEELGLDWDALPEWHRTILTDLAFNVGNVSGWKKVFTNKNPLAVLREARRKAGGKHSVGMDNRVARLGIQLGLIRSVKQARQLGLKLADLPEHEVAMLKGESNGDA
jgi:GH24 family phage-related lysozyme (muramidase)